MKKVWILEKWVTRDEYAASLDVFNEWKKEGLDVDYAIDKIKSNLDNPSFEGYWCGHVGRSNYKVFCYDAIESLRYNKGRNFKFRVVKAEIEDNSTVWTNYVNPIENDGVLRYLYTQIR